VRAAEFWLYFPNQRLQQGLQPYKVPEMYFFYPSPQEANYYVNIDAVADLKFDAAAKQVSQFEPSVNKYRSDWQPPISPRPRTRCGGSNREKTATTSRHFATQPALFNTE